MIAQDQPTIFDSSQLKVVVSGKTDGNTRPEWSPPADTVAAITRIAGYIGAGVDAVVAMDVGAHTGRWDEIIDVTSGEGRGVKNPNERIAADALVTSLPGLALLLPVADCNAVAIHDPMRDVLAVVHLGWKSTVAGLATKVVQYLQHTYHCSATDLRLYMSPAIKAESYVFDEVKQASSPEWGPFLQRTGKTISVDLPGFNRQRFIDAGVMPQHIQVSQVNTATSDAYFSHYRSVRTGEPEGRFALLAMLAG